MEWAFDAGADGERLGEAFPGTSEFGLYFGAIDARNLNEFVLDSDIEFIPGKIVLIEDFGFQRRIFRCEQVACIGSDQYRKEQN